MFMLYMYTIFVCSLVLDNFCSNVELICPELHANSEREACSRTDTVLSKTFKKNKQKDLILLKKNNFKQFDLTNM